MSEVSLSQLLGLLDEARAPMAAAFESADDEAAFSFEDVRESLRSAYLLLDGRGADLEHGRELANRKLLPFFILHFGASYLAQLAQRALTEGPSSKLTHELLKRSRELTRVLERHLFGGDAPAGENVVQMQIGTRKHLVPEPEHGDVA